MSNLPLPNGEYQLDLVKRLAFNRLGGSADELKAAHILQDEIASFGGTSHLEPFMIPWYDVDRCELSVTEPFERTLEVTGVGRSGCTDGVIEAELHYAEDGNPISLRGAKGKVLLLNELIYENWQAIVDSGAIAYIVTAGEGDADPENTDLDWNYLRPYHLEKGRIPGFTIRTRDAIELLRDGAKKVRLCLHQTEFERESHNVVAEIKGTDRADEFIVMTAHYDSVPFSRGAWDNATGSADLMALYAYYTENRPRRSIRFIWCGSEERGLLGSKAYVAAHKDELAACRMGLNIDMTGPILGADRCIITGIEATKTMVEYMARECGHFARISRGIHSSDSTPFADSGIPTISFARAGRGLVFHCRRDVEYPLGAEPLARTQNFMRTLSSRPINSEEFPIPREIPDDMREKIDEYFRRKPRKEQ